MTAKHLANVHTLNKIKSLEPAKNRLTLYLEEKCDIS